MSRAQVPGLLGSLCQLRVCGAAQQLASAIIGGTSLVSALCRADATPLESGIGAALGGVRRHSSAASSSGRPKGWEQLQRDGHVVNPCNSPNHPAVVAGVLPTPAGEELSVQEAYNPESSCFGCGPSSPDGLHLRSRRMPGEGLGRLEARLAIPARYCAFPGIVNGGILSTIMDCHGNWAAAVCLMDKGCLPRPPLTLTASMSVIFKEPTPPNTELILRSRVLSLRESAAASGASTGGGGGAYGSSSGGSGSGAYGSSSGNKMAQAQMQKATVEVEVVVLQPLDPATVAADAPPSSAVVQGAETAAGAAGGSQGFTRGAGTPEPAMKILAVGRGVFKRLGALRAL